MIFGYLMKVNWEWDCRETTYIRPRSTRRDEQDLHPRRIDYRRVQTDNQKTGERHSRPTPLPTTMTPTMVHFFVSFIINSASLRSLWDPWASSKIR